MLRPSLTCAIFDLLSHSTLIPSKAVLSCLTIWPQFDVITMGSIYSPLYDDKEIECLVPRHAIRHMDFQSVPDKMEMPFDEALSLLERQLTGLRFDLILNPR
jgi:hypothetical protein